MESAPTWIDDGNPECFDVVLTTTRSGTPEIVVPVPSDHSADTLSHMVRMVRKTHNLSDDVGIRCADQQNYEAV